MEGKSTILLNARVISFLILCTLFSVPLATNNNAILGELEDIPPIIRNTETSSDDSFYSAFSDTELEFLAASEGWLGNGSEVSPYLIQDLAVSHVNGCINFQNISSYIVFENCTLETGPSPFPVANFANVSHCVLRNSSLSATYYVCIDVKESPGFTIENCSFYGIRDFTFYDHITNRLYFRSSPNCKILNTKLSGCYIYFDGSDLSAFTHLISNVTIDSVPIVYLLNISDRVFTSAEFAQLIVVDCENISLSNALVNMSTPTVRMYYSNGCSIQNNTFFYTGHSAIILKFCTNSEIVGNDFPTYLTRGITLSQCNNCTVSGNNLTASYLSGIHVSDSISCEVSSNIIVDGYGFNAENISRCFITDNQVDFCVNGITLEFAKDCFLTRNEAYFCDITMGCFSSENITYVDETYVGVTMMPGCGAFIGDSSDIWIESSYINCGDEGPSMHVFDTQNLTFISNELGYHSWGGPVIQRCDFVSFCNNKLEGSVAISGSQNLTLESDIFDDCGLGIFSSTNLKLQDLNFLYGRLGIVGCSNGTLNNISICGLGTGSWPIRVLAIDSSTDIEITSLYLNLTVQIEEEDIGRSFLIEDSSRIVVRDGVICGCIQDGINLVRTSNSIIDNCYISDNPESGITLTNSSENTITNNFLCDNDEMGLRIYSGAYNFIYGNTFYNNSLSNANDDGDSNHFDDGISQGNIWSDYSGTGYYYVPGFAGSVDHFPSALTHLTTTITTSTDTTTSLTTTSTNQPISPWTLAAIAVGSSSIVVIIIMVILIRKELSE